MDDNDINELFEELGEMLDRATIDTKKNGRSSSSNSMTGPS